MILFKSGKGDVSVDSLKQTILSTGAAECDVLYIHSGMGFGLPTIKRSNLLAEILNIVESLNVPTIIFPTFTFSFCNHEAYDVQKSKTTMGALNEYARKSGHGVRSLDPLLSVYVLGDQLNLVDNLGPYSIGKDSNYDRLHHCGKEVKFLFLGADMRDCFTYTHYIEAAIGVSYRYNRQFDGLIVDNGVEYPSTVWLYSTYANCHLTFKPVVYDAMHKNNMLSIANVGDGQICCLREKDAYETVSQLLHDNPLCLTDGTFDPTVKDETYNPNNEFINSVR